MSAEHDDRRVPKSPRSHNPTQAVYSSELPPAPAPVAGGDEVQQGHQYTQHNQYPHDPGAQQLAPEPTRMSSAAIASCVLGAFGLAGMLFIGPLSLIASLVGLPLGYRARKEIRQDPAVEGDTVAYIGIITSWVGIALIVLMIVLLAVMLVFGIALFQGVF